MDLLLGVLSTVVIIIIIVGPRGFKKLRNRILLKRIQVLYNELIDSELSSYEINFCPRCSENEMSLLKVSPSGKSIEYRCNFCKRRIIGRLLPGIDGSHAAALIAEIKSLLERLDRSVDKNLDNYDINVSFEVDEPNVETKQRKYSRRPIPESVRNAVWRRDGGKCVQCGSQEKLEFDHVIPISLGGSNTTRNIQLLCESCNRKKSAKI